MREALVKTIFIFSFLNLYWSQYQKFDSGAGSLILSQSALFITILSGLVLVVNDGSIKVRGIIKIYLIGLLLSQVVLVFTKISILSMLNASLYGISALILWSIFKIISNYLREGSIFFFGFSLFIAGSGILSGLFGYESFLGFTLRTKGMILGLRPTSGLLNEMNMYGLISTFAALYSSYLFCVKKISKLVLFFAQSVFIVAIFLSFSRSALLAYFVSYFLIVTYKSSMSILYRGLGLGVFILMIYFISTNPIFITVAGTDVGLANRQYIWPYAWQKIVEAPISGYGFDPGANKEILSDYLSTILKGEENRPAHNSFLDFSLKGGLAVGMTYLIMNIKGLYSLLIQLFSFGNSQWSIFQMRTGVLAIIGSLFLSYGLGGLSLASILVNFGFYNIIYGVRYERN